MATTYTDNFSMPMMGMDDPHDQTLVNDAIRIADREIAVAQRGKAARNYLINYDFTDAINIRGKTTYTGIVFSVDGWRAYHADTTHTIADSGLTVSGGNPNLYQMLDTDEFDASAQWTAAIKDAAGNVYVWSGIPTETSYAPVCVYLLNGKPVFRATGEKTWVWAGLFKGVYNSKNLPDIVLESKAARLLDCQRRAVALGGVFRYRAVQIAGSIIDFAIPLPVTLRARPSFDASALTVYSFPAMTAQTDFSFAVVQETANGIVIRATKAGHGLTDAVLNIAAGTVFSADLT